MAGNVGKIINRVERTAKLPDLSGSLALREKVSSWKTRRAYVMANEAISKRVNAGKQAYATESEVYAHFRKLAEGVLVYFDKLVKKKPKNNSPVKKNKKPITEAKAIVEQIGGRITAVYGHSLELPFAKRGQMLTLPKKKLFFYIHELSHIFDGASQPRLLAIENRYSRIKTNAKHTDFYNDEVYIDHSSNKKESEIIPALKNKIDMHFKKHKVSLNNQVIILQFWRYYMISEFKAMKEELLISQRPAVLDMKKAIIEGSRVKGQIEEIGVKYDSDDYPTKTQKLKALKEYNKSNYDYLVKQSDEEDYLYTAKTNLLKDMTSEAIMKVRKNLASKREKIKN